MANVRAVLEELKDLGALGTPEDVHRRTVEEVTVESGAPSVPLRDARGSRTAALLTQTAEQLREVAAAAEGVAEASAAAAATIEELLAVWTDPGPEADEEIDEPVSQQVEPPKKAAKEPAVSPQAVEKPENYEKLIESVRRRVRGEDLTPTDLARAHGEEVDDGVPDVVPLGKLDLTPSWPTKE